jgi:MFS family permease
MLVRFSFEEANDLLMLPYRYKRSEFGVRAAIFFSAAALAGSFGGLLAAAIANMDGVGGKPGWAWIFILGTIPMCPCVPIVPV